MPHDTLHERQYSKKHNRGTLKHSLRTKNVIVSMQTASKLRFSNRAIMLKWEVVSILTASLMQMLLSSSILCLSLSSRASCLALRAANMSFLAVWELSDSWEPTNTHTHVRSNLGLTYVTFHQICMCVCVCVWPKGQRSEMFKGQISTSCSRLQHKQSDWLSRLGWGCVLHLFQCYERG